MACRPRFTARPVLAANGQPRIRRLLIANRGEIACRIISTCKILDITSIAIYADEDRDSLHVQAADEAICLGSIEQAGGNPHQNSRLVIEIALANRADAIHPGYGYLSENAEFARGVRDAGLLFVGPSLEAISVLGDKRRAKEYLMQNATQVPLIPGYSGTAQDFQTLELEAEKIGFPVLIKAAAGGGGKGMRVVHEKASLRDELGSAQSEAQRSFGSSDCLLEKYIERGKHIEIQIMGDSSGEVICLFDRECSIQRRHQKIIEEAPSPWLQQSIRVKMMEAAKEIGKLLKYENAGTIEFIVDVESSRFFFLEVNTRIQVEHAITEEITGIDIVALQLLVAGGGLLAECSALSKIVRSGHSIECRLCAEDPAQNFMPASGLILNWAPGIELLSSEQREGVRIETAIRTGSTVSVYFDSMIAKIIVWAVDRASAIAKMVNVLRHTICVGINTNHLFLQACLLHPSFNKIDYNTNFISDHIKDLLLNPFTDDMQKWHERLSFLPPLFTRWIATRPNNNSNSSYRPFSSIRPGFRTQPFDLSNRFHDIVVVRSCKEEEKQPSSFILTWSVQRSTSKHTSHYQIQALASTSSEANPQKHDATDANLDPGTELARDFNATLAPLLERRDAEEHQVRIVEASWRQQQEPSTSSPSPWLTASLLLECDGAKLALQLTTDRAFLSRDAGAPQLVYVSVPALGCAVEYERYTVLSWGEAQRMRFQGSEMVDEMRVYRSVMPCKVLRVLKGKGEAVVKGEAMLVVESMKTEVKIVAAVDGVFEGEVKEGQAVGDGVVLCRVVEGEGEGEEKRGGS